MPEVRVREATLEEQVLRALFDAPASARECARGLTPYDQPSGDRVREVACLLGDLVERAQATIELGASEARYSLTRAGSERLADLVE